MYLGKAKKDRVELTTVGNSMMAASHFRACFHSFSSVQFSFYFKNSSTYKNHSNKIYKYYK